MGAVALGCCHACNASATKDMAARGCRHACNASAMKDMAARNRRTAVIGLGVGDEDVVHTAAGLGQLLLQRRHEQPPELLMRGVHQGSLVPEDEVRIVGRPVLQPAWALRRLVLVI